MNPTRRIEGFHRAIAYALAAISLAIVCITPADAVNSQTWRLREKSAFEKAEMTTVSLSQNGTLRLAPPLKLIYEAEQPYIWAIAQGRDGTIYASGGNDGVIYRIDADGRGSEFFRADEPEVHALVVDAQGRLFAGTAPGGRIYRIEPDGESAWTYETEEEYVWSLVFDDDGNLYAGTGVEGRIIRVDQAGQGQLFFDSAETHIRTLVRDDAGNILAGTAGHGLIFRIDPDGNGFVVYDAPLDEVVTLVRADDGTIYAATVGGKGRGGAEPVGKAQKPKGVVKRQAEGPNNGGAPPPVSPPSDKSRASSVHQRIRISTNGAVLAVSADGYAREVWAGKQEVILSLALTGSGDLLMGSSVDGRIYRLETGNGDVTMVGTAPSSQVTALARRITGGGDRQAEQFIIAGSNLGTVALIDEGHATSGVVESPPLDAQSFATWGRITWRADLPKGTSVTIQGRSGNTEDPDRTWSEWSEELTDPRGAVLDLPAARFLQWRAILESDNPGRTPALHEVSVSYLQRNLPPVLANVTIAGSRGGQSQKAGRARQPQGGAAAKSSSKRGGNRNRSNPASSGDALPGTRDIRWKASDPNGDQLAFDVHYRAVDETTWKMLRKGIDESHLKLDTTAMPDGTYIVRVTASDAPANPPEQRLTTERLSMQFDVDNTPPRVERLRAQLQSPVVRLQFVVSDSFSIVRQASYAVDAGEWVAAQPEDGVNDDLAESYDLTVPDLAPGEHSIVVRVTDAAGNVGAGKAIVDIP
jgi:sugar lactone lactonase YvrE